MTFASDRWRRGGAGAWLSRVTIAVDIVVPDVLEAVEFLTASLTGPFYRVPEVQDRVEDRRNGVFVDLLPAGKVLKHGCKVPFPDPKVVAEKLQIVSLEDLVSLKLDSWHSSPNKRHRDKSDVVELILRRKLPRDLAVNPAVRALYLVSKPGTRSRLRSDLRFTIYDLRLSHESTLDS